VASHVSLAVVRIGIVAYWFNRGQGVVARQLRSALDSLGNETAVLARPTRATNIDPSRIDSSGVWAQSGVTAASDYVIPIAEYEAWAQENELEVVLFDQNYQFDEIARLRDSGVLTVGRFVWEQFSAEHVGPASRAFDVIYSMTACEQERYGRMGIESPRVHWGCHPDLIAAASDGNGARDPAGHVSLLFPGGFMSKRKPVDAVVEAFRAAEGDELRLLLKAQVDRRLTEVRRLARGGRIGRRDKRIEILAEDLQTDEYMRLFASADAIIAPSRWEGLGLHLYEATALGIPVVTNDNPPMNEIVRDGHNGLLVPGLPDGEARSGIPAFSPDIGALTAAIERLRDPELRARLHAGALEMREELGWERTRADLRALLEDLSPAPS
jgi:glycosyltransferase involved in cell wall biosynthesis